MKFRIVIVLLCLLPLSLLSQDKKSKGDTYFYGYQYQKAIEEYTKEQRKAPLSNPQLLNLADSYFKIGAYDKASKLYLAVNKNDTIISGNRVNKLLQTLSKNSSREKVNAFLKAKSPMLRSELLENAEFNFSLLDESSAAATIGIKNLAINSSQTDFSPAFYKEQLLFSSSRPFKAKEVYAPSGEAYLDIYIGKITANGDVTNASIFKKVPASKFHKSTPYYAEEVNKIFYILSNTEDGDMAFDENGKNALAMGVIGNYGKFGFLLKDLSTSFYYPFYDHGSSRIYFAANFEDSFGGTDLYYVVSNNGQIMSAPINLGPRINSPGNEIAPYIYEGSLYFSSDVFYGLGGMDVYKSTILGKDTYSIPINIGKGINSDKDDFGLIIKKSDNEQYEGYFASNRPGGKGKDDIYYYTLNKAPGLKTFAIKGNVVNQRNNLGIAEARIRLIGGDGVVLKETNTKEDGSYTLEIPWVAPVTIEATKEHYSIFSKTYNEEGMEDIQMTPYLMDLALLDDLLVEKEGKTVVALGKFYFEKNKSVVDDQIAVQLDKVVDVVNKFPDIKLRIETHTDSRGRNANNIRLSQNRSDAIKMYLLSKGVPASTIVESIGYGEERIMNNCTEGTYCLEFLHKQNERTLIEVVN